jgi:riboflavin kinase/FMN adenylyltransferase
MQVVRHYTRVSEELRGAVVALGNFDGVHRGHQAVIGQAASLADEMGVPLGAIVFEPYPREYFNPGGPPFRLTSFHSKARMLERLGVEILYVLSFDAAMAGKTAPEFVHDVLIKGLGILHLVVGYDFHFGRGRSGDAQVLRWMGLMEGFGLTVVEAVMRITEGAAPDEIFSSSRIREHIVAGRMREAAEQLGHWWSIEGHVRRGDQIGRTLGFPTANIDIRNNLTPAQGIYAVWVEILPAPGAGTAPRAAEVYPGVAYFGRRPTFDKDEVRLEVFLFDFKGDLYGRQLRVSFIELIRGDWAFPDAAALTAQMVKDAAAAREILALPRAQLGTYELGLDTIGGSPRRRQG